MRDAVTTARFLAFLPEGLTMGIDDANTVDRGRRLKSFRHIGAIKASRIASWSKPMFKNNTERRATPAEMDLVHRYDAIFLPQGIKCGTS